MAFREKGNMSRDLASGALLVRCGWRTIRWRLLWRLSLNEALLSVHLSRISYKIINFLWPFPSPLRAAWDDDSALRLVEKVCLLYGTGQGTKEVFKMTTCCTAQSGRGWDFAVQKACATLNATLIFSNEYVKCLTLTYKWLVGMSECSQQTKWENKCFDDVIKIVGQCFFLALAFTSRWCIQSVF